MRVQERIVRVMTQAVLSIDVDEPVSEVLRYFSTYPIHHLPVVQGTRAVGMLSSADVMKLEHFLPRGARAEPDFVNQRLTIRSLLRGPPITVQAGQSLEEAAALMAGHSIHALLVVDAQDHLIGILTTTDIMQAALAPESPTAAAPGAARPDDPPLAISDGQLERAFVAARALRESAADPQDIALALLCLLPRLRSLEEVLRAAERYVTAGQDEQLHGALLRAIAHAKDGSLSGVRSAPAPLGLGAI
jgi:CBS domain-containing protein